MTQDDWMSLVRKGLVVLGTYLMGRGWSQSNIDLLAGLVLIVAPALWSLWMKRTERASAKVDVLNALYTETPGAASRATPLSSTPLVERAVIAQAEALARAFEDPGVIAAKLAAWVVQNFPDRVRTAYWVTLEGDRDKGIQVELRKRPIELTLGQKIRLSVGALIGAQTAGLNVNSVVWRSTRGWEISVGIGAVTRYSDVENWSPVVSAAIKIPLG